MLHYSQSSSLKPSTQLCETITSNEKKHLPGLEEDNNSECSRPGPSVCKQANAVVLQHTRGSSVLLANANLIVCSNNGGKIEIRVLLDQGSEATFVTEKIVQMLKAKKQPAMIRVTGIDNILIGTAKSRVNLTISPIRDHKTLMSISALVLPMINNYSVTRVDYKTEWSHLHDLEFADPSPFENKEFDILIGADYSMRSIKYKIRTNYCVSISDLQLDLQKFWEIEECPKHTILNEAERKCEEHFKTTHSRTLTGRYIVRLPFKDEAPKGLGCSLRSAISMLAKSERRLKNDRDLQNEYYEFLNEYKNLGHMVEVDYDKNVGNGDKCCVYLPHHPIMRENSTTTRVRVVFNASSPTSTGVSLNDLLLAGPKLQAEIPSIILRWRNHRFVVTADICKMFRQILIDPRDVDYQRIVCRLEPNGEMKHFQLMTVTYGTTSAPYLANRVLKQLAEHEGAHLPSAKVILD